MGAGHAQALSNNNLVLAERLFRAIDKDHLGTIDVNEAKDWWKSNFSSINARAMFEAVDFNHDGIIDLREWIEFWNIVRRRGHSDEEIEEELENLGQRFSWTSFQGVSAPKPGVRD
jgi:Ca2+-binding EF-hand superfamily protein